MTQRTIASHSGQRAVAAEANPHTWALSPWARTFRRVRRRWAINRHVRRLCVPFDITGAEYVSQVTGPAIIVANHTSHFDTAIVLHVLPPRLYDSTAVAAAADRFYRNRLKGACSR